MRIVKRSHRLKIGRENLFDLRVVCKVNRLDFSPHAAFVHYLRLACYPFVSVATHCHEDNLMKSGSSVLQQCQYRFLAERNLAIVHQCVKDFVHSFTYICQFPAYLWLPSLILGVSDECGWASPGLFPCLTSNSRVVWCSTIGQGAHMFTLQGN